MDQLTRTCVVVPVMDKTAATAAKIFHERWLAIFPDPAFVITDGGTHFRCELFREIARLRGFEHHIVAPYSQWGNGGIERLNRTFLKSFRALMNAMRKDLCDWVDWAPTVQEALNKVVVVPSRGNKTPAQLLTGVMSLTAAGRLTRLGVRAGKTEAESVDDATLIAHLQDIHAAMGLLWDKAVQTQHNRQRYNASLRAGVRRRKCNIPRINVGDAVLVAQAVRPDKLSMTWTGPHRVTNAVSPYVYECEPMLPVQDRRRKIIAHIVRVRRFADALLGTPADRRRIEREALTDFPDNVVKRFVTHRTDRAGQLLLKVRWLGYDHTHDTGEPAHRLAEDVPQLLEQYLRQHDNEGPCARTLATYFGP